MPGHQNTKHNAKTIAIIDETVKVISRIEKQPRRNIPRLRKQLQNDEILKNYFVFDNEKDQLTTFRIENHVRYGNNIITQQVRTIQDSNRNHNNVQSFTSTTTTSTVVEDSPNLVKNSPQLSINALSNNQDETNPTNGSDLNNFLLQLFSAYLTNNFGTI